MAQNVLVECSCFMTHEKPHQETLNPSCVLSFLALDSLIRTMLALSELQQINQHGLTVRL